MGAALLLHERHQVSQDSFAELRIWRVRSPVRGSDHVYKYSLAYVVAGECVLRYDNEAGKGDHRHVGRNEYSYAFRDPAQLLRDFWSDVDRWRARG
jgi:hypothetical protein